LILAGSPLSEVLTIIAQLVESQGENVFCTIWFLMTAVANCTAQPHPIFRDLVLV
jgi:hypothetical protein